MTFITAEIQKSGLDPEELFLSSEDAKLYRRDVDMLSLNIDFNVREDPIENGKVVALYKVWLSL